MESKWRRNVWDYNFNPLETRLAARSVGGLIPVGLYVTDTGAFFGHGVYNATPTSLAVQVGVVPFNPITSFPYGATVEPDH